MNLTPKQKSLLYDAMNHIRDHIEEEGYMPKQLELSGYQEDNIQKQTLEKLKSFGFIEDWVKHDNCCAINWDCVKVYDWVSL